jgi:hypothetical protein
MSKETLKADITPAVEVLAQYSKLLSAVITTSKLTIERDTDGTNAGSMSAIQELLDHPYTTGKIRPILNGMHKVLYKDAEANLKARRKEEDDALKARAPKSLLPKNGKKTAESAEADEGLEITDPAAMLEHT